MADAPPIRQVINLPPVDTVRAFDARDRLRATARWDEMWHQDHARAFTVAKVAKLDLLASIRASLDQMLRNGGTFEQWQADIVPTLQRAGWWGQVSDRALTGTDETITVDARRLRTIYDTNLRMSRAAGRWTRIQALKGQRPFLRYVAVLDARTRPAHRAWHGTIRPVDDEWWDTHYPPCGWFCRCTVRQLSQADLDAKGWKVTDVPPAGAPTLYHPAGRSAPVAVPAGIAPGFAYNPGKASMAAAADKATRSLETTAAVDLSAARSTLDELVKSDAFLETLNEPGAAFPVMVLSPELGEALGGQGQVVVGRLGSDLDDARLLPEIGEAPDHVFRDGDRFVFWKSIDGRLLRAEIGRDAGGRLFLLLLRIAEGHELADAIQTLTDLLA